jgi:small nuclear ribonucleoprotein (snRNP)-like protein
MNLVVDDAEEVSLKKKTRKQLGAHIALYTHKRDVLAPHSYVACISAGRIMLKGDNITLMQGAKA